MRPSARLALRRAAPPRGRLRALYSEFAPAAPPPTDADAAALATFVAVSSRLLVLTGAGISTESGVPDYRSPAGAYARGYKPMTHQQFVASDAVRRRYWARSFLGWPAFSAVQPNAAHAALAALASTGRVHGVITQNVDRLHTKAGSRGVVELHGTTHEVECMACGARSDRGALQRQLAALNPGWDERTHDTLRPDGDVELGGDASAFALPPCGACGAPPGSLKPWVVFFGDNVPPARAAQAAQLAATADAALVVGTSLATRSSRRLVEAVLAGGRPVAVLSLGPTPCDGRARLLLRLRAAEALPRALAHPALATPDSFDATDGCGSLQAGAVRTAAAQPV